jgi:hypothetical protein
MHTSIPLPVPRCASGTGEGIYWLNNNKLMRQQLQQGTNLPLAHREEPKDNPICWHSEMPLHRLMLPPK